MSQAGKFVNLAGNPEGLTEALGSHFAELGAGLRGAAPDSPASAGQNGPVEAAPPSSNGKHLAEPWHRRAKELADWCEKRLIIRTTAYGAYWVKDGSKVKPTTTKEPLTRRRILRHFRARGTDDVIGGHMVVFQQSEGIRAAVCLSKLLCLDIDLHDGDTVSPEANLAAALAWCGVLIGHGFHPLLIDSNGKGGLRLYVLFDDLVLSLHARQLGRWLVRDWQAHGLLKPPDVFPAQNEIGPEGFGNWLRFPGRHHKREHWSRVWDGTEWLEGDDAIDALINATVDSSQLIPASALEFEPEPKARHLEPGERKEKHRRTHGKISVFDDYNDRALWASILEPAGWTIDSEYRDEVRWTRPGKDDGTSARTRDEDDRLRVFSDAADPFKKNENYTKFDVYALLNHAGDTKAAATALEALGYGRDNRPEIFITTEEADVNDQAIKALEADEKLFQRNHQLVQVVRSSEARKSDPVKRELGSPLIRSVQAPTLRELLTCVVQWRAFKHRSGQATVEKAHPPAWSVNAILARGQWEGIRHLLGVVEVPTLRADGSAIEQAGYDEATGLLYVPSGDFPSLPKNPTQKDAEDAADLLLEIVRDFPFKTGHNVVFLAGLLTAIGRFLIDGPVPLFLFEANTSGAGKTLLCDIIAMITTGRPMTRTGYYHDAVETDKQITSTALAGDSVVLFDNIENGGRFGNSALDRALTGRTWRGRLLGKNEMTPPLDLTTVFFASGNNLALVGDVVRRIVNGRLESPEERPEERTGFAISACQCGCRGDLLDHVRRHRAAFVIAAVTILKAFVLAKPLDPQLTPMDFPAWAGLIRNAVRWATGLDPALGRKDLADSDPEREYHAAFLEGWLEVQTARRVNGMTVADFLRTLCQDDLGGAYPKAREAIQNLWPKVESGKLPSSRSIGMKIGAIRGKVFGSKRFEGIPGADGFKIWCVK